MMRKKDENVIIIKSKIIIIHTQRSYIDKVLLSWQSSTVILSFWQQIFLLILNISKFFNVKYFENMKNENSNNLC